MGNPAYDYRSVQPQPESGGRVIKALERPARLFALMGLCALVWWFSYDHGRESSKTRVSRIEAENVSLREKVALLEEEARELKARLGALPEAGSSSGQAASASAQGALSPNQGASGGGAFGGPSASAPAPEGAAPLQGDSREASQSPAALSQAGLGPAELAPAPALSSPAAGPESGRLTVKLSENKGLFGGRVVITMVELDSLGKEALVRAHYRETGRRLAQLMAPGDILEIDLDGEAHQLYLDQIRGTLAFFLVDDMPGGGRR